jgi:hypothetical protein
MQTTDYKDLDEVPAPVASATAATARNAIRGISDNRFGPKGFG